MGIGDAALETGGCERFGGEAFSLVERKLRAGIGWYVSVGSSTGVLIWDKDSDERLPATSGSSRSSSIAAIRQNIIVIGMPDFCRSVLSSLMRIVCRSYPQMNQLVTFTSQVSRLSICGPVGPLNNC